MVEWLGFQKTLTASRIAVEYADMEMIKKAVMPKLKKNMRNSDCSQLQEENDRLNEESRYLKEFYGSSKGN